jgi:transposase
VIRRGFNDSQHRQVVAEETIRQASLRDLEVLAIDEIDVGRKNKYFTFVIDWRTGASVYVGDGKGQQVFDRFHIPKPMNDKLTQLRREVQSEAETMDRKALKGLRWLLLKHPENLDESKNERVRLQEALDLNRSLSVAYYLKEDPSQIWQ